MATFLMFGKYSAEGMKQMNAGRTAKAVDVIKKNGGSVQAMYAALGPTDLVFVLDFPGNAEAMKASVALSKLTGIGFSTCPACTVEEFDKLTG